jgi:ribonuclease P/MRP protein subunit POP5
LLKRIKHRYLSVEIDFDCTVTQRDFLDAVWATVTGLYGEFGASQTGLKLIDFFGEKRTAIIRVSLPTFRQTRAAIASVTRIAGREAAVHVVATSGTLKALRDKKK